MNPFPWWPCGLASDTRRALPVKIQLYLPKIQPYLPMKSRHARRAYPHARPVLKWRASFLSRGPQASSARAGPAKILRRSCAMNF